MKEFYGDSVRWFIGEVIDGSPPYGLEGRVRVRIHGVHSPSTKDIPQKDLPWCQVVLPTTEQGVSGLGQNPKLSTGALVFGMFMDGMQSQVPLILGSLPRTEHPSNIQQDVEFLTVIERASKESTFYEESVIAINPKERAIRDQEGGTIGGFVKRARRSVGIKFFLTNGYTMKQSMALISAMEFTSNFTTVNPDPETGAVGIGGWKGQRLVDLKRFSNDWDKYSTQLSFIVYELNTTQQRSNVKLLRTDTLDAAKLNCSSIIAREYLKVKKQSDIDSIVNMANNTYEEYMG